MDFREKATDDETKRNVLSHDRQMKSSTDIAAEIEDLKQRRAANNQSRIAMSLHANKAEQLSAARLSAVHDELALGDLERALKVAQQNEAREDLNQRLAAAAEVGKEVEAFGQTYVDNAAEVERAALALNDALRELEYAGRGMYAKAAEIVSAAGVNPNVMTLPHFKGFSHRAFATTFQKDAFEAAFVGQVDLRGWPVMIDATVPTRATSMTAEAEAQVLEVSAVAAQVSNFAAANAEQEPA